MRVKWTHKALANLDTAVAFIAADKPAATTNVALAILNAAKILAG